MVGKVIAPTALLTAILYYFGWARTEAAAQRAGLNQALFGYSTSDYVLRSVGPLYRPIGTGIMVLLLWFVVLAGAELGLERVRDKYVDSWRTVRIVAAVLLVVSVGAVVWGAAGLEDVRTETSAHFSAYLVLAGAGILWVLLVFAKLDRGAIGRFVDARRTAVIGMIMLLILIGVFAIVLRLAFEDGAGSINGFIEGLEAEPEVVVTSDSPLDIRLEGVELEIIQADEEFGTQARFRYTGMRLLIEANDRFFLVTPDFGRGGQASAVSVVPASSGLRIDFLGP
ncbi:MAG: hypothetical protein HKN44_05870 [Ilumatobacter sp.]|nr:hypothetical protein [Ilumatobacter sp.]